MRRRSGAQRWVIVACFGGGLGFGGLVAYGLMSRWGADQWGPFAAWLSGAATLAAVVVALRQASAARRESMRLQLARLVDHEVSRRRECLDALGQLWGALVSMGIEFVSFTNYLDRLPRHFNPNMPRTDDVPSDRMGEPLSFEMVRHVQAFYNEWVQTIQPPLFVALATLHGTELYAAVFELNAAIKKMADEEDEGRLSTSARQSLRGAAPIQSR